MSVKSLTTDDSREAEVNQLLRDMYALNERMEGDRNETERLKAETKRLRTEFLRLSEENRAVLSRLKVAW